MSLNDYLPKEIVVLEHGYFTCSYEEYKIDNGIICGYGKKSIEAKHSSDIAILRTCIAVHEGEAPILSLYKEFGRIKPQTPIEKIDDIDEESGIARHFETRRMKDVLRFGVKEWQESDDSETNIKKELDLLCAYFTHVIGRIEADKPLPLQNTKVFLTSDETGRVYFKVDNWLEAAYFEIQCLAMFGYLRNTGARKLFSKKCECGMPFVTDNSRQKLCNNCRSGAGRGRRCRQNKKEKEAPQHEAGKQ